MNSFSRSLKKLLSTSLLAVLPFSLTSCSLRSSNTTTPKSQSLTIWRVDSDKTAFDPIIAAYEKKFPDTQVNYRVFSPTDDYETTVINALAAGTGPDIWEIQNDELPRHKDKLVGFEMTEPQIKAFQKSYAPALAEELIADGKIYGLPITIDPLVLFVNNDHFERANLKNAPKTWAEAFEAANTLTAKIDSTIIRPGMALGTGSNVDRAYQILELLMLQYQTQMTDSAHRTATFDLFVQDRETGEYHYPGKDAFAHYASFAKPTEPNYSWDSSQPYSTLAFAQGNVSMMINYLSLVPQMKLLSPKLNFSVGPVPQLAIKRFPVNDQPATISQSIDMAKYRALVVSKPSLKLTKQKQDSQVQLARGFIEFVTSDSGIISYYANKTNTITPRILDSQNATGTGTTAAAAVLNPTIHSWYKGPSPRLVDSIFQQLIADITENNKGIDEAFSTAAQNVTSILR